MHKSKIIYENPSVEILNFNYEDIIRTSGSCTIDCRSGFDCPQGYEI